MKKNLRRKIHTFLQSEDGKVSVKAPLALAAMSGSFLLTEIMFTPPVSAERWLHFGLRRRRSLHSLVYKMESRGDLYILRIVYACPPKCGIKK